MVFGRQSPYRQPSCLQKGICNIQYQGRYYAYAVCKLRIGNQFTSSGVAQAWLSAALLRQTIDAELIQYKGEGHVVRRPENQADLLRRATEAGVSEVNLPREWGDWATRASMPSLRIPDFHMSSVSQAP